MKIAELMTTDLLYFDPDARDRCAAFCRRRRIDLLPDLDDSQWVHQLDEASGGFIRCPLGERTVDADTDALDVCLPERFRDAHVLFVRHDTTLAGVIHFSDYNQDRFAVYLFGILRDLERTIRRLLIQAGLGDADMLAFLERNPDNQYHRKQVRAYRQRAVKHGKDAQPPPPFQTFDLLPLAQFLDDVVGIRVPKEIVGDRGVRNIVMHAHEFVDRPDGPPDSLIYDFDSFADFFGKARLADTTARRLRNRLRLELEPAPDAT
jgi:hypothetical protein